ncbi:MAG: AbrB/MazE/SpoVT family DNA-binding domain-containing protein [Candidatus Omnitrophica bacterium]|nr:AbrB/MazE/SpoVT family DNA-binding domain-containing protein [Candidatus Omnitrophota bacterium]
MTSTISLRGQTAIPAAIRKRYNLTAHTLIEWVDDGNGISVVPVPNNPIKTLHGKFKGVDLMGPLIKMRREERARA